MTTTDQNPTTRAYGSLTDAYDFFNRELFAGQLPPCLITMQRHKGSYGYFSAERFASLGNAGEITDEIAMNPQHFAGHTLENTLSTLAHEMCHLWQFHHGKRPRAGYHDKQFAAKMREIGLICSTTGQPGGKETGQKMDHYIDPAGAFARACAKLQASGATILYHDRASEETDKTRKQKASSKTKYTCPGCEANAWAKPKAKIICGECHELMISPDDDEADDDQADE